MFVGGGKAHLRKVDKVVTSLVQVNPVGLYGSGANE